MVWCTCTMLGVSSEGFVWWETVQNIGEGAFLLETVAIYRNK